MKNCIILTTKFPPYGGVGVQRVTKLVKYLPNNDINPIVVTVPSWSLKHMKDPSMNEELNKNLEIHTPFFFDKKRILPGDIAKLFNSFPDNFRPWCKRALNTIKKILKTKKIDYVFITVKSFSLLSLVKLIKEELGIPVILDFRDPFSFNFYNTQKPDNIKDKIAKLEKEAFKFADVITTVTPYISEKYKKLYPNANIQTVTNGFDPADFFNDIEFNSIYDLKYFSVGYSGTFSSMVPMEPIVNSIVNIYEEHSISIKLNISTSMSKSKLMKKFPKLFEYDLINYFGFLPHKESIKKLYDSQLLLFMLKNDERTKGVYSGKALEYLNIPRPILFLNNKDSSLSKVIEKTQKGFTLNIDDPVEITESLLNLYESWKNKEMKYEPDLAEVSKFSYKVLTNKLSKLINKA